MQESELIEVLWKQDVDLGFSLAPPSTSLKKEESHSAEDDAEKLNALLELKNEKVTIIYLWDFISDPGILNCFFFPVRGHGEG